MPNNLQILAYIQCMKDWIGESIKFSDERNNSLGTITHKAHLKDICNLEKFIRG